MIHNKASALTYRHILIAIITCVIALAIIELIASLISLSIVFDSSYDVPRNPNFLRAWEDYTRPPDNASPNAYTIIVISNSQGYLAEHEDGTLAYSHQLEQILEAQLARPVEVLNWSIPASHAIEQIIAVGRAIAHQPDLILWVTYYANLEQNQFQSLAFYSSDITRLIYAPEVSQYLDADFVSRHSHDGIAGWLGSRTHIGRLAHILTLDRYLKWWRPFEVLPFVIEDVQWNEGVNDYAKEFYNTLRRADNRIPLVTISMPLDQSRYESEAWEQVSQFANHLKATYDLKPDVYILDATSLIPQEEFYTHTHFSPSGHRQFAEWLADQLIAELKLIY